MNKVLNPLKVCTLALMSCVASGKEHLADPVMSGPESLASPALPHSVHKMDPPDQAFAVDIHGNIVNGVQQPWKYYTHNINDLNDRTLIGEHMDDNLRPWALAWSANKSTLYGLSRESEQTKLLTFDPATGLSSTVAVISGYDASMVALTGIAIDQNNVCFMIGLDRANHDTVSTLYRCNLLTGEVIKMGEQSTAPDLHDIVATCDGSLYGVDAREAALYRLNKSDGSADLVGPLGFSTDVGLFNVTYDRKHDRVIQYVTAEGQSYYTALAAVNTLTGEATFMGDTYTFGTYVGASESSCDEQQAPFDINSAFNGSWYNPLTDGQGFVFDVLPDSDFFYGAWFTYAEEASDDTSGQRWMTAQGPLGSGNSVKLALLNSTGGVFDDTSDVDTVVVGDMIITFNDCSTGTVSYSLNDGAISGSFAIQRIAGDQVAYCESLINAGIK